MISLVSISSKVIFFFFSFVYIDIFIVGFMDDSNVIGVIFKRVFKIGVFFLFKSLYVFVREMSFVVRLW